MPETLTVFLWSLPEELSFRDYLRGLADRLRVCPLRPAAWYAARRLFSESEICDCRRLVAPAEREMLDRRAAESASRLLGILQSYPKEPWLEGFEFYHKVTPLLYYLYCWDLLLNRLRREADQLFRVYGPFSRGSIPGGLLLETDVVELLVTGSAPDSNYCGRDRLRRRLGACLGHGTAAGVGVRERVQQLFGGRSSVPAPKLLLAGLQETDTVFQAPLATALQQRLGRSFHWWRLAPARQRLSGHEVGAESHAERDAEVWLENDPMAWRRSRLGRCIQEYLVQRVADACRRLPQETLLHRHAEDIARILVNSHPNPVADYHRVSRYLSEQQPSLVVGFSNLGLMAHVRSWCRRHQVPYVRLPHGVEAPPRHRVIHDADIVGVTGKYDRRRLEGIHGGDRCVVVGGMHLAEQGKRLRREIVQGETRAEEVCYLVSTSLYSDYPDTFTEIEDDLGQLAAAVRATGLRFRIRPHPRSHDREVYQEIHRNRLEDVALSDPERSLADDLRRAAAGIARLWSGACVLTLYCRIPLVAWLPRPGEPESAARLARLPMVARRPDELQRMLEQMLQDEEYRREVLKRQDRLLEEEIEDPFGDEYGLAVRMVESLMNRRSLKLKGDLV